MDTIQIKTTKATYQLRPYGNTSNIPGMMAVFKLINGKFEPISNIVSTSKNIKRLTKKILKRELCHPAYIDRKPGDQSGYDLLLEDF